MLSCTTHTAVHRGLLTRLTIACYVLLNSALNFRPRQDFVHELTNFGPVHSHFAHGSSLANYDPSMESGNRLLDIEFAFAPNNGEGGETIACLKKYI